MLRIPERVVIPAFEIHGCFRHGLIIRMRKNKALWPYQGGNLLCAGLHRYVQSLHPRQVLIVSNVLVPVDYGNCIRICHRRKFLFRYPYHTEYGHSHG